MEKSNPDTITVADIRKLSDRLLYGDKKKIHERLNGISYTTVKYVLDAKDDIEITEKVLEIYYTALKLLEDRRFKFSRFQRASNQ